MGITINKTFFTACLIVSGSVQSGMIDTSDLAPWEICGLCHNLNGISPMAKFPKLAGQKPAYIQQQFENFNSGKRTNDGGQMQAITTEVKAGDIKAIASYFSELKPPLASEEEIDQGIYAHGKSIFLNGKSSVPACASCHADADSSAPWLYGQHSDYLEKQLTDFAKGDRESDVMENIAGQLSEEDVVAVAAYLTRIQPRKSE